MVTFSDFSFQQNLKRDFKGRFSEGREVIPDTVSEMQNSTKWAKVMVNMLENLNKYYWVKSNEVLWIKISLKCIMKITYKLECGD